MKMKLLITLALSFIPMTSISSQEWKVYNAHDGSFSILTPGMMQQKRATISTGVAALDVHTLFYDSRDSLGNFLYLVNFYDLPEEMVPEDTTDFAMEFLLNTMDQSVSDVEGDLQYSTPVMMGTSHGLMWRSKSDKKVVKCRAYLIGRRFYMLQVFSVPENSLNADVDRFLESFTLRAS